MLFRSRHGLRAYIVSLVVAMTLVGADRAACASEWTIADSQRPDPSRDDAAKAFYANVATGKVARGELAPELSSELGDEVLHRLASQLMQLGAAQWTFVSTVNLKDRKISFYKIVGADRRSALRLAFGQDNDGRISVFRLRPEQ